MGVFGKEGRVQVHCCGKAFKDGDNCQSIGQHNLNWLSFGLDQPHRLPDVLEMMAELEAACARLAAGRISKENIEILKTTTRRCAAAAEANDPETYNWENETFHTVLYESSCNSFLAEAARKLHKKLQPTRREQSYDQALMFKSLEEHIEIISALEAGNGKAAAILARRHVPTQ